MGEGIECAVRHDQAVDYREVQLDGVARVELAPDIGPDFDMALVERPHEHDHASPRMAGLKERQVKARLVIGQPEAHLYRAQPRQVGLLPQLPFGACCRHEGGHGRGQEHAPVAPHEGREAARALSQKDPRPRIGQADKDEPEPAPDRDPERDAERPGARIGELHLAPPLGHRDHHPSVRGNERGHADSIHFCRIPREKAPRGLHRGAEFPGFDREAHREQGLEADRQIGGPDLPEHVVRQYRARAKAGLGKAELQGDTLRSVRIAPYGDRAALPLQHAEPDPGTRRGKGIRAVEQGTVQGQKSGSVRHPKMEREQVAAAGLKRKRRRHLGRDQTRGNHRRSGFRRGKRGIDFLCAPAQQPEFELGVHDPVHEARGRPEVGVGGDGQVQVRGAIGGLRGLGGQPVRKPPREVHAGLEGAPQDPAGHCGRDHPGGNPRESESLWKHECRGKQRERERDQVQALHRPEVRERDHDVRDMVPEEGVQERNRQEKEEQGGGICQGRSCRSGGPLFRRVPSVPPPQQEIDGCDEEDPGRVAELKVSPGARKGPDGQERGREGVPYPLDDPVGQSTVEVQAGGEAQVPVQGDHGDEGEGRQSAEKDQRANPPSEGASTRLPGK